MESRRGRNVYLFGQMKTFTAYAFIMFKRVWRTAPTVSPRPQRSPYQRADSGNRSSHRMRAVVSFFANFRREAQAALSAAVSGRVPLTPHLGRERAGALSVSLRELSPPPTWELPPFLHQGPSRAPPSTRRLACEILLSICFRPMTCPASEGSAAIAQSTHSPSSSWDVTCDRVLPRAAREVDEPIVANLNHLVRTLRSAHRGGRACVARAHVLRAHSFFYLLDNKYRADASLNILLAGCRGCENPHHGGAPVQCLNIPCPPGPVRRHMGFRGRRNAHTFPGSKVVA